MLRLNFLLSQTRRGPSVSIRALVDSGASLGMLLPLEIATRLGLMLEEPEEFPVDIRGNAIRGAYAEIFAQLDPDCGLLAEPVSVFVPDDPIIESLAGALLLSRFEAVIRLGDCEFPIPSGRRATPAGHVAAPGQPARSSPSRARLGHWRLPSGPRGYRLFR